MKREYAVGEKFEREGIILETVAHDGCGPCHFVKMKQDCPFFRNEVICASSSRSDKKSVVYVRSKKQKLPISSGFDDALSTRLAEIERASRDGVSIKPAVVLELVSTLRQYMAHAEYTNRMMESIEAKLKECHL